MLALALMLNAFSGTIRANYLMSQIFYYSDIKKKKTVEPVNHDLY